MSRCGMLARMFAFPRSLFLTAAATCLTLSGCVATGQSAQPGSSPSPGGPRQPATVNPAPTMTASPEGASTPDAQPSAPVTTTPAAVVAPYARRAKACRTGRVALTFDDGPHPQRTGELLRWLTRNDVPATFFMVGSRVHTAPGMVRSLEANPRLFTLANHTWKHPDLRRIPAKQVRQSLAATDRAIGRWGTPSPLMRPPYGAVNPTVLAAIRAEKLVPVLWNVDSQDWHGGNRHQIAGRILAQLQPKRANVVLQHDGINNSYESVRAVPIVVAEAKRRGYCFVPLLPTGQAGSMLKPVRSAP